MKAVVGFLGIFLAEKPYAVIIVGLLVIPVVGFLDPTLSEQPQAVIIREILI